MSISSINANSLYYGYLTGNSENVASDTADAMLGKTAAQTSVKNSAYAAYGANMYSGAGESAMQQAVEAIKNENGGKVTFAMVKDYRAELEKGFETTIQAGLLMAGFEETDDFHMTADASGNISVLADDPEVKSAVEAMLQESPKLGEQFLYIQALSNVERAQGTLSAKSQMQLTQASLASDAVDILLNGANLLGQLGNLGVGYSSLTANYSESQIQYMLGANYLV